MTSLLEIYGLPIAASGILAACLAVIGAQVAARDRAMQTLCMTQGALLGVLFGIGCMSVFHISQDDALMVPLTGGMLGSLLTLGTSEALIKRIESSKNTYFTALFAVLISAGHLVSSLFPGLESHMTQRYFGDLAVITDETAWITICVSGAMGILLMVLSRQLTKGAFFESMLGMSGRRSHSTRIFIAIGLTLAIISFSTQVVGLLFTITSLFVPTALLSQMPGSYRAHLIACGAIAFVASILGFTSSLSFSHLPTVPLVGLCMVTCAALAMLFHRVREQFFAR